ncbi:hypothetical protein GCM10020331_019200 [Ectobacillus funiculus]
MGKNLQRYEENFCIIVEGSLEEPIEEELWWQAMSVYDHVEFYISEKNSYLQKEAIKAAAKDRDIPKRDVYQAYHIEE